MAFATKTKLDECQVVGGELVVARCDSTTLFDPVEEAFDPVAGAVEIRAEANWILAVALRRDVRPSAFRGDKFSDPVGIVAAISKKHQSRPQPRQELARKSIVMGLSRRRREPDRQAVRINQRMNLLVNPPRDRPIDCLLFRVMQEPC